MLTYEDCLCLSGLDEDEIRAIAEHENLTEFAAMELGQYLIQSDDGLLRLRRIILDDIERAERSGKKEHALVLKLTLKRFVDSHPDNPATAG